MAASAAVITLLIIVTGQIIGEGERHSEDIGMSSGIAVSFTVLGVLVLMSVPRHPIGRLMIAAGLIAAAHLMALSWTSWTPLAWIAQWAWVPSIGLILLAILLFPEGSLPSSRWRLIAALIIVGTFVATVLLAVVTAHHPRLLSDYVCCDSPLNPANQRLFTIAVYAALFAVVGYLGALFSLGARWRRADIDTRRQLACLLLAGLVFLAGLTLDVLGVGGAWAVAVGAIPVGMAVAILRYRLYDVDLLVNRTIVWFLITALVVVGVIAIVGILRQVLVDVGETRAALVATGLAVVTIEPLHRKVQRAVDRLFYGDRDDPYLVIARLGEVLGRTVDFTTVMPLVTRTIAQSLQVPYVAVELQE
ncbi:MAG: sensor histidine kinase, partial [Actinomycetota bacterium]|nr:sensor histidine kinase [Actinomycetota bacterium]